MNYSSVTSPGSCHHDAGADDKLHHKPDTVERFHHPSTCLKGSDHLTNQAGKAEHAKAQLLTFIPGVGTDKTLH